MSVNITWAVLLLGEVKKKKKKIHCHRRQTDIERKAMSYIWDL